MTIAEAYKKVDKYLSSESQSPIIVDLPSAKDLSEFKTHYHVGKNRFVGSHKYAIKDNLPDIPKLLNDVSLLSGTTFLTGISVALKLKGAKETKRFLKNFISLEAQGKLILVTVQCADYLKFSDPRISAANRVLIVSSDTNHPITTLLFISKNLKNTCTVYSDGLDKMVEYYDQSADMECNVVTSKTKKDFPLSLIPIRELNSSFDSIVGIYSALSGIEEQWGTSEQWEYLANTLIKRSNWDDFLVSEYAGIPNLANCFHQYSSYSSNKKWAHFVSLKVCGVKNNEYLSYVLGKTDRYENFIQNFYNFILDFDTTNKHFRNLYLERRNILKNVAEEGAASEFCKIVSGKNEKALGYLTDYTWSEKRMLLSVIAKYRDIYTIDKVQALLTDVSPDLLAYLKKFRFKEDIFTHYFEMYKYCKIANYISDEMKEIVSEQAIKREYNKYLVPRASIVSKLSKENALVYFTDAMGVEYLGYIQEKLYELGLVGNIKYGLCNLPSITSKNKEFVGEFNLSNTPVRDIKAIDEIKHNGVMSYNYETEKLPIHLYSELSEIQTLLKHVESDLLSGQYKRVYLISDHGASRLAVINEHENKWEVSEKGKHSGRCCPKSDISEKPEQATEENDFWCLANYDRFRGGRKANVEVHGGATLEEVIVPIIEITRQPASLKCMIDSQSAIVTASFKKNAVVRIYISEDFEDVKVLVEGQYYEAHKTENKYYYTVEMPDVKKAGMHTMDVYVNNSIIAQNLLFEVKKEGINERKFF